MLLSTRAGATAGGDEHVVNDDDDADAKIELGLDDNTADEVEHFAERLEVAPDDYALFALVFVNELMKILTDEEGAGRPEALTCVQRAAHELFQGPTEALPKVKPEHATVRRVCQMVVSIARDVMPNEDDEDA
jgi:hypothetical protein